MRAVHVLRTRHLQIRRFRHDDADAFVDLMTTPEVTRFMSFPPAVKTREGARALLDATMRAYDTERAALAFAVEETLNRRFAGFCGLSPLPEHGAELMYVIEDSFAGRGYATEVARALAEHALSELGLRAVTAFIVPSHVASRRVAESAGFMDTGLTLREGFVGAVHAYVRAKPSGVAGGGI